MHLACISSLFMSVLRCVSQLMPCMQLCLQPDLFCRSPRALLDTSHLLPATLSLSRQCLFALIA